MRIVPIVEGHRREDGIRRAVRLATLVADDVAVLVLFDADDDCPARLGPELLSAARSAVPGNGQRWVRADGLVSAGLRWGRRALRRA